MADYTQIPIIVIGWNNLFFVRRFINQIRCLPNPIVILDNNSSYEPLLEYYRTLTDTRFTIHLLPENYGHEVYKKRSDLLPSLYVISDPDLELNPMMPSNVVDHLLSISDRYSLRKIGLALDISEPEKFIKGSYGELVYGIESRYYDNKLSDRDYDLYVAPTDTTFCLVNTANDENRNLRIGGPFIAKHLPWYHDYISKNVPRDELLVWIKENKSSSILHYIDPQSLV